MWLILQLSELPAGAFAHSSGLEAAHRFGAIDVEVFLDRAIAQAERLGVPFVTHEAPLSELDERCDAMLTSHVTNRASRAQGRALASAGRRIFEVSLESEHMHHAPIFGALCRGLGVSRADAARLYLHGIARGALSSAVRLGMLGPLEAQRLQTSRAGALEKAHAASVDLPPERAAQTAPLLDLWGALHDALDTRLFQS